MSAIRLQKRIIEGLRETSAYPHPVDNPRVIETHISWVILTGENAYKIKKAVRFGFLDFSTLEKRKRYCEEELRLQELPLLSSSPAILIGKAKKHALVFLQGAVRLIGRPDENSQALALP